MHNPELRSRHEVGMIIKLAGAMGIFVLLSTVAHAFFTYHSREVSTQSEWAER